MHNHNPVHVTCDGRVDELPGENRVCFRQDKNYQLELTPLGFVNG
jgi:hypothetical protein